MHMPACIVVTELVNVRSIPLGIKMAVNPYLWVYLWHSLYRIALSIPSTLEAPKAEFHLNVVAELNMFF